MPKYRVTTDQGTFEVTTADEKPASSGPERFNPNRSEPPQEDFLTSIAHFPVHGLEQAVHGAQQLFTPGERMMGAHNVFAGGSKAAAPFALPAAALTAPAATGIGLLAGGAVNAVAPAVARSMGASEGGAELTGDVLGTLAGGAGAYGASRFRMPVSPSRLAVYAVAHKLRIPMSLVDTALEHLTPPEDIPLPGQSGPGPYFHERSTVDPQFRGPTAPAEPIEGSSYFRSQGTVTPPPSARGAPRPAVPVYTGPSGRPSLPSPFTPAADAALPSGRKVGGIQNQVESAPVIPKPAGPPASLLDDIAMAQAGKKYAKLDSAGQATVQKLAAKIHGQESLPAPAEAPATSGVSLKPRTPESSALPAPEPSGGIKVQGSSEAIKNRVAGRANMMEVHAVNKYQHLVDEMVNAQKMTQDQFAAKPLNEQVGLVNDMIDKVVSSGKKLDQRFRNKTGTYGKFSLEPGYLGETKASMQAIKEMLPKSPEGYVSPYGLTPP